MIIPIAIVAAAAGLMYYAHRPAVVHVSHPELNQVGGVLNTDHRIDAFRRRSPYLYALLCAIKRGRPIDPYLVSEAMNEAYDQGNWRVLEKLHRKFGDPNEIEMPPEETEETKSEEGETSEPDKTVSEPSPDSDPTPIVVGKNSPFEGVSNEAWIGFVEKLETEKVGYKGDRHVGRFYHSKDRLKQLGYDPEQEMDGDKQYDALEADMKSSREHANDLIREYEFKSVKVAGQDHIITLSGMLGLIKSAGPINARSWLETEEDRTKFARTTKTFLDTNGAF